MAKNAERIAVVGGGIAGLFCAYALAKHGRSVDVFEASERFGGRIRSVRLTATNRECPANWRSTQLEFCAEFGPMRLELDKQLLVRALLTHLGIEESAKGAHPSDGRYLVPFPSFESPSMPGDAAYEVDPDEAGKNPLQLLQLGLFHVVRRLKVRKNSEFTRKQADLEEQLAGADAGQAAQDKVFAQWLKGLGPTDYWEIQTEGCVDGVPLYAMGFWNLLSDGDHLSYDGINKLRDLGTFYHLLPENPNAAEWLVWWLVNFGAGELQTLFGGMECIVEALIEKIEREHVRLFKNITVVCVKKAKGGRVFQLGLDRAVAPSGTRAPRGSYKRVIMALPRSPLEKIAHRSEAVFRKKDDILRLLDSAFGFPMVKMFVVVNHAWWTGPRANKYATRVPTRELHYWKGATPGSPQGMIMVYTDRPASAFWANYVPPGAQWDAASSTSNPLPHQTRQRLINKAVQYITQNDAAATADDIKWYGIRDWGREPYGGANHAWRPERKYWVVMRRLAEIGDSPAGGPSFHVCGEAYSDYHGFIEGSLRSAVYVVHRILKSDGGNRLSWLGEIGLSVDDAYLDSLRDLATKLDAYTAHDPFLFGEAEPLVPKKSRPTGQRRSKAKRDER
jgi:hypothetical protein